MEKKNDIYPLKNIKNVHCLFEQSGTFKNAFKKLGYNAKDIDISNAYHQTDVQCNLFKEIMDTCYGKETILRHFNEDDFVFAFFPCDYFSDQSQLVSRGDIFQSKNKTIQEKAMDAIRLSTLREEYFRTLCILIRLAGVQKFKMVVENPSGKCGFLKQYLPCTTKLIINNRSLMGDIYRKPTVFFFYNCTPTFNLMQEYTARKTNKIAKDTRDKMERSLISQEFAENFIRQFLL